ncbi:hypothetical protein AGJ34_21695 [Cronobacter dublinensis subsp. dublinensis]|nr:hypothetical protein [Cronobacter dublinensis subsp. dublinensis]EGT5729983.1 hypothetical protein [Cronobacter dublinensis subsp. dublinensis]
MSEIASKNFSELTKEEKETHFSSLCKVATKALHGAFNLEETEKVLKQKVVEASEAVNSISKQLGEGQEHNRQTYNDALKELNRCNRKLDKFLDNYEDTRDGTGNKLKDLRSFLDDLINDMTADQVN